MNEEIKIDKEAYFKYLKDDRDRLVVGKDYSNRTFFKWLKQSGHNSRPLAENEERYTLNIGGLYGGIVKTHHSEWSDEISWEWTFTILDREITGAGGGGLNRDTCMTAVENHIQESIEEIHTAFNCFERRIYDSLIHVDRSTDEWYQERLE